MGELDVTCPLFVGEQFTINELNSQIIEAASVEEKVSKAGSLMGKLDTLLLCEKYDEKNPQCTHCQNVISRKKAYLEIVFAHERKLVNFINKLEKCLSKSTEINLLIRVLDMKLQHGGGFTNRSQDL